jgi:hypothetical protein
MFFLPYLAFYSNTEFSASRKAFQLNKETVRATSEMCLLRLLASFEKQSSFHDLHSRIQIDFFSEAIVNFYVFFNKREKERLR